MRNTLLHIIGMDPAMREQLESAKGQIIVVVVVVVVVLIVSM